MQQTKSVEAILEEIIQQESPSDPAVQSISIVSKTGLLIAGKAASIAKPETFSAMAAIMYSSAEATRTDALKDKLEYIVGVFRSTKLIIAEVSSSLLIIATTDRAADNEKVLESMNKIVTRTKQELVWLR
ncbi:MAG TPA: roadblock/LC7 domain-containing protein [Methanomassiliicoccales archaeon]|nr:roadblock/LC7 domain-containing protein [Methanomassiliicoccales archaeon]